HLGRTKSLNRGNELAQRSEVVGREERQVAADADELYVDRIGCTGIDTVKLEVRTIADLKVAGACETAARSGKRKRLAVGDRDRAGVDDCGGIEVSRGDQRGSGIDRDRAGRRRVLAADLDDRSVVGIEGYRTSCSVQLVDQDAAVVLGVDRAAGEKGRE